MAVKEWIIPGVTMIFAAGAAFTSFDSAAKDVEEIDKRVQVLESKSGKQEIVDIKIEGVEKRLDKMEDLMAKMLEVQQQQAINQAKICSATNADCD
tara:strand:+ start:1853 stop:2140 length:288 start_codon:yes stop_codon:yes gene_type:complete